MKTKLSIIVLCFLLSNAIIGQPDQSQRDRIESARVAFITDRLGLTPDESAAFWPRFNAHQEKVRKLKKQMRKTTNITEDMSEAEQDEAITKHFKLQRQEINLRQEFYNEIKSIVPIKKIAKLPQVEREFKHELLRKMKEHRQGNRPGPRSNSPKG